MGHDLGHTPFGHNGEVYLNERHPGGFQHNVQSLRVVDVLDRNHAGRSMNLTEEVRDGRLNHTGKGTFTLEAGRPDVRPNRLYQPRYRRCDPRTDYLRGELPLTASPIWGGSPSRIDTLVRDLVRESDGRTVFFNPKGETLHGQAARIYVRARLSQSHR